MPSTRSKLSGSSGVLLRGSQEPRINWVPDFVSSAGQEAIDLAALAGLHLDPWEELVLTGALGERLDGKWAAFEVGLVAPRQNGKGSVLEARELAGLFLFGERLLIHSAHEQGTSSEHFRRLLGLIENVPEFTRRMKKPSRGKGAEAIELNGGQRILFKTRTGGGGRGLTGDLVVLDEAMILPEATTAALVPTMAARSVSGNPQLWYAGSAVDKAKNEHGAVLARVRERGIKRVDRLAYFEWSAEGDDPGLVPAEVAADPELWAQANPGLGIRISAEHIGNECAGALGPREFAVERLGIGDWPTPGGFGGVIDPEAWIKLRDSESSAADSLVFVFDVTPERSFSAISVAGRRADGLNHVEVIEHDRGTGWVADKIAELVQTHDPLDVLYDERGPAASLIPELSALGVTARPINAGEMAQACGMFVDAVNDSTLRHLGQPELLAAVRGVAKRPLGDSWAWSRKSSAVDISPLVACTIALWGRESAIQGSWHPL